MIKYWESNNLGDLYNIYIANHINKKTTSSISKTNLHDKDIYMCGSVLKYATNLSFVYGAGFKEENDNNKNLDILKIKVVRGNLTKKKLGIKNCLIGDPGLILPYIYKNVVKKKYKFGIIPHYNNFELFKKISLPVDTKLINISFNDENYNKIKANNNISESTALFNKKFDEINSCEILFSSSLHGLIFGHALGIPTYWINFKNSKNEPKFKFLDYYTFYTDAVDKINPFVIDDVNNFILNIAKIKYEKMYTPKIKNHKKDIDILHKTINELL